MQIRFGRIGSVIAGAAVLMLMIGGCTSRTTTDTSKTPVDAPLDGAGRWREDFQHALRSGVSSYERQVLADGIVTSQEEEDAHDRVRRCLADSGLTITYSSDGGFEIGSSHGSPPSNDMHRTNAVLEACEAKWDQYVTFLFEETRRNPEKQDEAKITLACLRRAGLVTKTYTERKWRTENDTGVWSFNENDPAAVQCRLDPLGVWREK